MIAIVAGQKRTSFQNPHPQSDNGQPDRVRHLAVPHITQSEALVRFGHLEFLQLLINGRSQYGLLDNQASRNFMSKTFAQENSIGIEDGSAVTTVGDATTINTIGRAKVRCVALLRSRHLVDCEFEVLEVAIHPIILGLPFLCSNSAFFGAQLTHHPSRSSGRISTVLHLALSQGPYLDLKLNLKLKIRLRGRTIEREVLATIDKAATADLISLGLARWLGLSVFQQSKHKATIILGDGRKIQSVGTVQIPAGFAKSSGRPIVFPIDFIIVQTLASGMILSSFTLQSLRQRTADDILFEWVPVSECRMLLCAIDVNKDAELEKEDPGVFLQNITNQKNVERENVVFAQEREALQVTLIQAETEKKLKHRDRLQNTLSYYSNRGDTVKAQQYLEEIQVLEDSLRPSRVPSVKGVSPKKPHFWKRFKK